MFAIRGNGSESLLRSPRLSLHKPVNTISFALADEAKKLWNKDIESNNAVKAVVFTSAKPDMFIAGADIFDIQQMEGK